MNINDNNIFEFEKNVLKKNKYIDFAIPDPVKHIHLELIEYPTLKEVIPSYCQSIPTDITNFIKDIEKGNEKLIREINEIHNREMMEILERFGINENEIPNRVKGIIQDFDPFHEKIHIFIDGDYAFSITKGYDLSNGTDMTVWIRPEYIFEMKE